MRLTFPSMFRILALALVGPALPGILAQNEYGRPCDGNAGEIPPDNPTVRVSGIGNAHMEITTTPQASNVVRSGTNLLHNFWDYESARAFEQVCGRSSMRHVLLGLYKTEFLPQHGSGARGQALKQAVV